MLIMHDWGNAGTPAGDIESMKQNTFRLPIIDMLSADETKHDYLVNQDCYTEFGETLVKALNGYGIRTLLFGTVVSPSIIRFKLKLENSVRIGQLISMSDDIALALGADRIRIDSSEPGASQIGIEIPRPDRELLKLRTLIETSASIYDVSPLSAILGINTNGTFVSCNLCDMPNLLITGRLGSGKSTCVHSILINILFRSSPDDVKFVMIDPRAIELSMYNGIPHLLSPVVTDPQKTANTLLWVINETVRRYSLFVEKSVQDINAYQAAARKNPREFEPMPLILVIIDELIELLSAIPTEVENMIAKLAERGKAAGCHILASTSLHLASNLPDKIQKAFPSRITLRTNSAQESRMLNMDGAEQLLDNGDMLYLSHDRLKPLRLQSAFVTQTELKDVLTFIKLNSNANYDVSIMEATMSSSADISINYGNSFQDELLLQAAEIVVEAGYASVSLLQRRMNLGYPHCARLIDCMEQKGFIGPFEGSKPRKVFLTVPQLTELRMIKNQDIVK